MFVMGIPAVHSLSNGFQSLIKTWGPFLKAFAVLFMAVHMALEDGDQDLRGWKTDLKAWRLKVFSSSRRLKRGARAREQRTKLSSHTSLEPFGYTN